MIDLVSNDRDSYPTRINLDQVRARFSFGNVNVANPVVFENVMDDIKVKSWMDSEILGSQSFYCAPRRNLSEHAEI